jgi:diaminopimelate decarboxylase
MKTILKTPLQFKKNQLTFDGISIAKIAEKRKTPFYLYSKKTLEYYFQQFYKNAKKAKLIDPLVCFAVKSNSNHDVLKKLHKMGSGADVVSMGEMKKAMKAGISPQKIVFSGVGKTEEEITFALKSHPHGIYSFNVESIEELEMINFIAKKLKKIARVSFRLNPEVNVKTHKHIATGNKTHKFGLLSKDILEAIDLTHLWTHTTLVGLSIHIGSQLTEMQATEKAIKELSNLALKINSPLEFLDIGGGLGIDYTEEDKNNLTSIEEYMGVVAKALNTYYYSKTDLKTRVLFEPGRIIVGKMGVLVSKIIRTKLSDGRHFTIIDAGMNDLIRPALYEAYHEILPAHKKSKSIKTDIVGPICETSDCFGEQRSLPMMNAGDLLVIDNAGAYGHTMASNYNERTKPLEYLI